MLPSQKAAVEHFMAELVGFTECKTSVLLNYLEVRRAISRAERDVVESKVTGEEKLICLFHMLKANDSGWFHLLSYLRANNQSSLSDKLHSYADGEDVATIPKRSALVEFSLRLATYYQQNYANLPTIGESPKHVKDAWVPLQIDGRSEDHLAADQIDHTELLKRLKSTEGRNVALTKGDPGMGKTTIVKKIAYDWAINYGSSEAQQFSLVLAVPLRSVAGSSGFDQLAIDYFLSVVDVQDIDTLELIRDINQLKPHLLVIFDGLDEYGSYSESPFKDMFAAPFQHTSTYCNKTPPMKIGEGNEVGMEPKLLWNGGQLN